MPGIARHDVARAELDTLPDAAIAAVAAFLRGSVNSGYSSVSQQQQPADGSFQFVAGTAARSGASKPRHRARTGRRTLASPEHVTASTPAAADLAAVGTTSAGCLLRSGMAPSAKGTAVPSTFTTSEALPTMRQRAAECSLRDAPQPVSCASGRSMAQSVLQQPVDAAIEETAASRPLRQPDRRSRGWWPPWDCQPRAAQRCGNMPAAGAAAGRIAHASGAHMVDAQPGASAASRRTVYDSADSLQAMTSQVAI